MKIYLSGAITGTDDYMDRFQKAEDFLKTIVKETDMIYNPAKINAQLPVGTTYEEYMKVSFTILDMCDYIYMLHGWEQSRGSKAELERALVYGKEVMLE